jgi:hypothetical protein
VHSRIRNKCKDCEGSAICEHKKDKARCKECLNCKCEHGQVQYRCKQCERTKRAATTLLEFSASLALPDPDQAVFCLQCRERLPASAFPSGTAVGGSSTCTVCQLIIEHSNLLPCSRKCGRHVKPLHSGEAGPCDNCRGVSQPDPPV